MNEYQQYARRNCAIFNTATKDGCYTEGVCRLFRDEPVPCPWFERYVLPGNPALEAKYKGTANEPEDDNLTECAKCGQSIRKRNNRQKYCDKCADEMKRERDKLSKRNQRRKAG